MPVGVRGARCKEILPWGRNIDLWRPSVPRRTIRRAIPQIADATLARKVARNPVDIRVGRSSYVVSNANGRSGSRVSGKMPNRKVVAKAHERRQVRSAHVSIQMERAHAAERADPDRACAAVPDDPHPHGAVAARRCPWVKLAPRCVLNDGHAVLVEIAPRANGHHDSAAGAPPADAAR